MKKLLAILLAALLVVCVFAACGGEEEQTGATTSVSAYKSGDGYTEIKDKLSWEKLNSFPVKSADMSIDELRQLCVDFFRYTKTACWIPDDNFSYFHNSEHTNALEQTGGVIYGGLPYIYVSSGSIYRLMDFMDEETGVVNIKELTVNPHLYGNQCSIGAYWGWARVINSADYAWTQDMVAARGFYRVGPYTYPDYTVGLSDGYRTTQILEENGRETMYKSYAELKHGDGIVYYTSAGHVVMIATDAHVEYLDEAKTQIDPQNSYVTVIDQTSGWKTATNEAGDTYQYEANVDEKWNFEKLYNGNYMPFTYGEFLGTDPIEETEVSCNIEEGAESITLAQLYKTKVTANYGISDIYAQVFDAKGNEVLKIASRASQAGQMDRQFSKVGSNIYIWGNADDLKTGGAYTVKITAQLGTGERPTVWEGKLTVE